MDKKAEKKNANESKEIGEKVPVETVEEKTAESPTFDRKEAEAVPPYRHGETSLTVAFHVGKDAFTATGIYCGEADSQKSK